MNKNKLIRLYKDFLEGKFITPAQRKVSELGLKKIKHLAAHSKLQIINSSGATLIISPVLFDKTLHPHFVRDIYECIVETAKLNPVKTSREFYADASFGISCITYIQSYSKNPVSNENIYVITEKTYKTFSEMPLPDITFKDITFENDLPALFLFEKFNTVVYMDYYLTPIENKLELLFSVFGYNQKFKFEPASILLYSKDIPPDFVIGENLLKDFVNNSQRLEGLEDKEIINTYAPFFYNLLLFLASKETLKYHTEELNEVRPIVEKNIVTGNNVKKNKQILERVPSYRFVDIGMYRNPRPNSPHVLETIVS